MLDVVQFIMSCVGAVIKAFDECMLFSNISLWDYLLGLTIAMILITVFMNFLGIEVLDRIPFTRSYFRTRKVNKERVNRAKERSKKKGK